MKLKTSRTGGIGAALALALAGCSPQAAEQAPAPTSTAPAVHPESGLRIIPVTAQTPSGAHVFQAEVAASPLEQSRGLMFRTEMGPDEGMLFPYDPPEVLSFWMRNTVLPLDIVFIGPDHKIINVGNGVPYSEASVRSEAPAIAVLELNRGRAEELASRD